MVVTEMVMCGVHLFQDVQIDVFLGILVIFHELQLYCISLAYWRNSLKKEHIKNLKQDTYLDKNIEKMSSLAAQLCAAAAENNASLIQALLRVPSLDPGSDNVFAAPTAASTDSAEALEALFCDERFRKKATWVYTLQAACESNAYKAFGVLLAYPPRPFRTFCDVVTVQKYLLTHPFSMAATSCTSRAPQNVLCLFFDALAPYSTILDRDALVTEGFLQACSLHREEAVSFMRSDPRFRIDASADNNAALRAAGHYVPVIRELLKDSRVRVDDTLVRDACALPSAELIDVLLTSPTVNVNAFSSMHVSDTTAPITVAASHASPAVLGRILQDTKLVVSPAVAWRAMQGCVFGVYADADADCAPPFAVRFECFAQLLGAPQTRAALASLTGTGPAIDEADVGAVARLLEYIRCVVSSDRN